MTTEAQKRASAKYDSTHAKHLHIKLNIKTDADIIDKLSTVRSIQGYIKELIRKDIGR